MIRRRALEGTCAPGVSLSLVLSAGLHTQQLLPLHFLSSRPVRLACMRDQTRLAPCSLLACLLPRTIVQTC